jgi:hypothetical protein
MLSPQGQPYSGAADEEKESGRSNNRFRCAQEPEACQAASQIAQAAAQAGQGGGQECEACPQAGGKNGACGITPNPVTSRQEVKDKNKGEGKSRPGSASHTQGTPQSSENQGSEARTEEADAPNCIPQGACEVIPDGLNASSGSSEAGPPRENQCRGA